MSNKDIEEDIKICKDFIEENKSRKIILHIAIENILADREIAVQKANKYDILVAEIKEKIEKTKNRINYLKIEISKTLKENEIVGTETEIDINEQYIYDMEIELEKLEITKEVLQDLLETTEGKKK